MMRQKKVCHIKTAVRLFYPSFFGFFMSKEHNSKIVFWFLSAENTWKKTEENGNKLFCVRILEKNGYNLFCVRIFKKNGYKLFCDRILEKNGFKLFLF